MFTSFIEFMGLFSSSKDSCCRPQAIGKKGLPKLIWVELWSMRHGYSKVQTCCRVLVRYRYGSGTVITYLARQNEIRYIRYLGTALVRQLDKDGWFCGHDSSMPIFFFFLFDFVMSWILDINIWLFFPFNLWFLFFFSLSLLQFLIC